MTGMRFSPNRLTRVSRIWGCECSKHLCECTGANAICERIIGTLRRECLDFVIPLHERHLYGILKEWVHHYNESRPHKSLGPGIPQPRAALPVSLQTSRHQLPTGQLVVARSILSGLHHDYGFEERAA